MVNGMKRIGLILGIVSALVVGAAVVACNGVLGIQSATTGDTVPVGLTCDYYCQTINNNCPTTTNTEYQQSADLCTSMCNNLELDLGTLNDTSGNTLGCRIHYAQLAGTSNADANCRFAGPLGGGVCGQPSDACNNFCSLGVPFCSQQGAPDYVNVGDCLDACNPDAGYAGYVFTTDGGSTGVDLPDGTNTLNCRFYHLENAYPSKARAVVHCPHTMPMSATCHN
jgi:hypothetical protein